MRAVEQTPGYEIQFMLNIYELPDALTPESRDAPITKSVVVNYVRGYPKDEGRLAE